MHRIKIGHVIFFGSLFLSLVEIIQLQATWSISLSIVPQVFMLVSTSIASSRTIMKSRICSFFRSYDFLFRVVFLP